MKRFLTMLMIAGALFAAGCTGVTEIKAEKDKTPLTVSPEAQAQMDQLMQGSKDQMQKAMTDGKPPAGSAPK